MMPPLMIFFAISLMLLTGCEDCWKIKPRVSCDVSFQFDRCRCRCLSLKNDLQTVDPKLCGLDWKTDVKDFPIQSCEGIAGFYVEDIAKHIRPEALETKQCYEDKCSKKAVTP
jgi:hypothetical protein